MTLFDVLYNWLQLRLVLDHRPHDESAKESSEHLARILAEVHQVKIVQVQKEEGKYQVTYKKEEVEHSQVFMADAAEALLTFISDNPERYDFE